MLACRRKRCLASGPEKLLYQVEAFFRHDAGCDFAAVIQLRHLKDIQEPTGSTALGIWASKNNPSQAGVDDRAGAHWAGFLRYVEVAVSESPILHGRLGLGDGQHFGMCGGILEHFDLVPSTGNDLAFAHDHGSDWHLIRGKSPACLSQGFSHVIFIVGNFHVYKVCHTYAFA